MLHRIRDQIMANRTGLINQMRAFCIEYTVSPSQGAGKFKADLPRALANELNDLTPAARRLLADLFDDLARLQQRIAEVTREIDALVASYERARLLITIPGTGPHISKRGTVISGACWCTGPAHASCTSIIGETVSANGSMLWSSGCTGTRSPWRTLRKSLASPE